MSQIFVCYSRADREFAERLVKDLRAVGIDLWFDQQDISPGDPWDSAIEQALATTPEMLVILSPNSVSSQNVMDELNQARNLSKRIIPVLYRPCTIPYRISRLNYIDFTKEDYDTGVERLETFVRNKPSPPSMKSSGEIHLSGTEAQRSLLGRIASRLRKVSPLAGVAMLTGLIWALSAVVPVAFGTTERESFPADYTKPSWCAAEPLNEAERTVCSNQELWPLDNELGARYKAAYKRVDKDAYQMTTLAASEGVWLRSYRNACGVDAGCLKTTYQSRMPVFDQFQRSRIDRIVLYFTAAPAKPQQ
jgi:hypothetical protein